MSHETIGAAPLVSVFVLCYNQSTYVVEALESVRRQTFQNIQLIITDDASTDESQAVIREWVAQHAVSCELLFHSKNQGICRTLNEALTMARGQYVAMVAADDTWLPEKLERQVALLQASSDEVAVVYTDAWLADAQGNRLPSMFIAQYRISDPMPEGDIFDVLVKRNFIPALTPLIRKVCLDHVGPYDERLSFEDWDMWLRISASFKFAFLPWPSGVYRIVPTSLAHRLFLGPKNFQRPLDEFMIREKCLALTRSRTDLREMLAMNMCEIAGDMYARAYPKALNIIGRAWRAHPSAKMSLMWLMAAFRLPHRMFNRIDAVHSAWSRRVAPVAHPTDSGCSASAHHE